MGVWYQQYHSISEKICGRVASILNKLRESPAMIYYDIITNMVNNVQKRDTSRDRRFLVRSTLWLPERWQLPLLTAQSSMKWIGTGVLQQRWKPWDSKSPTFTLLRLLPWLWFTPHCLEQLKIIADPNKRHYLQSLTNCTDGAICTQIGAIMNGRK